MQLDNALDLLSNQKRRQIIYFLEEEDENSFEYTEIVNSVVGEKPRDEKKRFRVGMTHIHLPRLRESDLIQYDERSETVLYDPDEEFSELTQFLQSYE